LQPIPQAPDFLEKLVFIIQILGCRETLCVKLNILVSHWQRKQKREENVSNQQSSSRSWPAVYAAKHVI